MMVMRKIIQIDEELCDGCGQCVPDCAEGALEIVGGKARMIGEKYCDGLGACLGACPTGALRVVERQAEDFDAVAVEKRLAIPAGGCPSARVINLQPVSLCRAANQSKKIPADSSSSRLSHWPVQIRLVPPTAPFLKNADLLVAADCTPIAYPAFQDDFLAGRVIMMGCPKFDDSAGYVNKFTEVFKAATPKSVTILIMEVPCCSAMKMIIREALKLSECRIPVEQVTIGVRGEILAKENW
jgi:Fe-S-cluster-containing hydrogenase component 2